MPRTATATPRRHQHVNIDGHRVRNSSKHAAIHPNSVSNNGASSTTTTACGGDSGPPSIVVEARVHSVGLSDTSLTFLIDQVVLEGLVSLESGVDTTLHALYGSGILDYKPLCVEAAASSINKINDDGNNNTKHQHVSELSPFTASWKSSTTRSLDPISRLSPRLAHHQTIIAQEVKKWEQIISYPYESRLKPLLEKQQERLRRWRQKRELMSPLLDNNNAEASISTSSDDDGNGNSTQNGGQNPPLYQTYSSANRNGGGGGGIGGVRRMSASSLSSRSDDDGNNNNKPSLPSSSPPETAATNKGIIGSDDVTNSNNTKKEHKKGVACQDCTVLTNHVVVGIKTVFAPEGCATASTSTDETYFLLDRRDVVRLLNTKGDSSRRDVAEKYSEILEGLLSTSGSSTNPVNLSSPKSASAPTSTQNTSTHSSSDSQQQQPPLLPQGIDIGYTDSLLFSFPSNVTHNSNHCPATDKGSVAADPTISISVRACVYVVPVEFPSVERQEHFASNRRNNNMTVDPLSATTSSFPKFKKRTLLVQNRLDSLVAFLDAVSRRSGGDSIRTSNEITLPPRDANKKKNPEDNETNKSTTDTASNEKEKAMIKKPRKATMIAVGSSTETYRDLYLLQHSSTANHHHAMSDESAFRNTSNLVLKETVEPIVAGAAGRTAIGPYVRTVFMDIHDDDEEEGEKKSVRASTTATTGGSSSPSSRQQQIQRKTPTLLFSNVAGHAQTLVPLLNVHRLRAAYGVQHHLTHDNGGGWSPSRGASPAVSPRPTTAVGGGGGSGAATPRKMKKSSSTPRGDVARDESVGGERIRRSASFSSKIPSTAATAPLIEFETLSSLLSSLTPNNPPVVIASLDVPVSSIVGNSVSMTIPSSATYRHQLQQQQGKRQPPALLRLRDTAVVLDAEEKTIIGADDENGSMRMGSSRRSSSSFASSSIMPFNRDGSPQQQQQQQSLSKRKVNEDAGKSSIHNHTSTSACMLLQASCWWTQHGVAAPTSMTRVFNSDQNHQKSSKKSGSRHESTTNTPRRGRHGVSDDPSSACSAAPSSTPLLAADYDSFVEFVASEQSEYLRQKGITSSAVPNPDDTTNHTTQTPRGRNNMLLSSSLNHHDRHDPNPLIGGRASDRLQQQKHSCRGGFANSLSAPGSMGSFHGALNTFNVFCLLSFVETISFLRLSWRQKPLQLLCVALLIMSSMLLLPLSASVVSLPHLDNNIVGHKNHRYHYKTIDRGTDAASLRHSTHDDELPQTVKHRNYHDEDKEIGNKNPTPSTTKKGDIEHEEPHSSEDEVTSDNSMVAHVSSIAQALMTYVHVFACGLYSLSSNIWLTRAAMMMVCVLSAYMLLYKRWLGNTWIAAQRLQEYAIAGQKHQYRQRRIRLSTVLFDEFETARNLAALYRQFKTEEKFRRRQARGHNHDLETTRVTTVEDATFALTTFLENRLYPEMHLPDYDLLSGLPATYTLPPPQECNKNKDHPQLHRPLLPQTTIAGAKSVVSANDDKDRSRSNQARGASSSSPVPRIPGVDEQFVAFPQDQFSDEDEEGTPDPQQQQRMMRQTIVTTGFTSPLDVPGVVETDPQTARDSEKWINKHHSNGSRSGGSLTATSTPAADSWGLFRQCSGGMAHHVVYDPYSTTTALQVNKKRACAPLLEYLQFSEHLRFIPCTDPVRTSHAGNIAAEQYLHPTKMFTSQQQQQQSLGSGGRWLAARRGFLVAPPTTHIGTSASTPLPLLSSTSNVRGDETNFLIHATFYDLLLYLETWLRRCAASYRTQSSTFVHSTVGHTCRQVTPWLPRRWLITGSLVAMSFFRSNGGVSYNSTNTASYLATMKKNQKHEDKNSGGIGLAGIPDAPQISFFMLLVATFVCLFFTGTVTDDVLKGRLEPLALSIKQEWGMMTAYTNIHTSHTTSSATTSKRSDADDAKIGDVTTTVSNDFSLKTLITATFTLWSEAGVLVANNPVFGIGYDKIENIEDAQKSETSDNKDSLAQLSSQTAKTDEQLLDTLFDGPSSPASSQNINNNEKKTINIENRNKDDSEAATRRGPSSSQQEEEEWNKLESSLGIDLAGKITSSSRVADEKRENSEALRELSATIAASDSSQTPPTPSTVRTLVKAIFTSIFGTTAYSISLSMHLAVFFLKSTDAFIISPAAQLITLVTSAFNVEVAQFIFSEKHQADLQSRALHICHINRERGETKASISTRWGRFISSVTEVALQQEYQISGAEAITEVPDSSLAPESHVPSPSTPRRLMRSCMYVQLFVIDVTSRSVLFIGRLVTVMLGSFVSPPVRYSIANLIPHVQYTTEMIPAKIIPTVIDGHHQPHHDDSSLSSPSLLDDEVSTNFSGESAEQQQQQHSILYRCSVARLCIFGFPLNSIHFDFSPIVIEDGAEQQQRNSTSAKTSADNAATPSHQVNDDVPNNNPSSTSPAPTTSTPLTPTSTSMSSSSIIALWAGEFVPSWALVHPCSSSPYALAGPLFCWELEIFLRVWVTAIVLGTLLVFPVNEYCKRVGNSIRLCRELADQVLGFSNNNNDANIEEKTSSRHIKSNTRKRSRRSLSLLPRLLRVTRNYFRMVASYIIAPLVALSLFHVMFCSQLLVRMVIGPVFWKVMWPCVKAFVGWVAGTTPLDDPNNFSDETDLRFAAPVFGNHLLTMAKGQKQFRTHAFHPLVSFTLDSTVLLREGTYHDQLAHRLNLTPNEGSGSGGDGDDYESAPHPAHTTTTSSSYYLAARKSQNSKHSSTSITSIIRFVVLDVPFQSVLLLQRVVVAFIEAVSSIRYESRLLSEPLPLEGHNTLLTTNQRYALHQCMKQPGARCPTFCLFAASRNQQQQNNVGFPGLVVSTKDSDGPQPLLSTTIQRKMLASSRSAPSYLWYDRLSRHWRATASPSLSGSADFDMSELLKTLQKAADGKVSGITEHSPLLLFNQYGKGYIGPLQFYYRSLSEVKSYSLADWTMRQIAAANLIVSLQADSRQNNNTDGGGVSSSSLQQQQQQLSPAAQNAPMMIAFGGQGGGGGLLPPLSPFPQQQPHNTNVDHQSLQVSASSAVGGELPYGHNQQHFGDGLISSDDGSPVQPRNATRPQSPLFHNNQGDAAPNTATQTTSPAVADHHAHPSSLASRFASRLVSLAHPHDDPASPIHNPNHPEINENIQSSTILSNNRVGGGTVNGGGGGPPRRWREQLRMMQQNQSGGGDYVQAQHPSVPSTPAAYSTILSRGANGTPITPPSAFDDNTHLHQRSDSNLSQLNLHRQQQQQESAASRRATRTKWNADDISARFLSALSGGGGVSSIGNRGQLNSNNNSSGNENPQSVHTPRHITPHTPYVTTTPPPPLSGFSRSAVTGAAVLAQSITDGGGSSVNPSDSIIRRRNNITNVNKSDGGVIPSSSLLGGGPIRDHENLWQRAPEMVGGAPATNPTSTMLHPRLSIAASMPSLFRQSTAPPGGASTSPENNNNSPLTDSNSHSNSSRKVIENSNKLTVPSPLVVRPSPTNATATSGGASFSVSMASAAPSSRNRRGSVPPPNLSFSTTASSSRPTATIIDSTRGGPMPRGSNSPFEPATPLHSHTAATPPPPKTKSPSTPQPQHKTVTLKQQPSSRSSRGSVVDRPVGDVNDDGTNYNEDSPPGRYNDRARNDSLASDVRFNSTGVFSNNNNTEAHIRRV